MNLVVEAVVFLMCCALTLQQQRVYQNISPRVISIPRSDLRHDLPFGARLSTIKLNSSVFDTGNGSNLVTSDVAMVSARNTSRRSRKRLRVKKRKLKTVFLKLNDKGVNSSRTTQLQSSERYNQSQEISSNYHSSKVRQIEKVFSTRQLIEKDNPVISSINNTSTGHSITSMFLQDRNDEKISRYIIHNPGRKTKDESVMDPREYDSQRIYVKPKVMKNSGQMNIFLGHQRNSGVGKLEELNLTKSSRSNTIRDHQKVSMLNQHPLKNVSVASLRGIVIGNDRDLVSEDPNAKNFGHDHSKSQNLSKTKIQDQSKTSELQGYSKVLPNKDVTTLLSNNSQDGAKQCDCFWSVEKCGCSCKGSLSKNNFHYLGEEKFKPCSDFSFSLTGGQHYSLPVNFFTKVGNVKKFTLSISGSQFQYLFDTGNGSSPFKGVSFEQEGLIKILGVQVLRGWNWAALKHLISNSNKGVDIEIDGCGLSKLSSDFSSVSGGAVKTVQISDSKLEMIGSGSFSTFEELNRLLLPKNRLRSIKRTDLPLEPLYLTEIDFRKNRLQTLEPNLFSGMPGLKIISLEDNPLKILDEKAFNFIITKAHISGFSNIPLRCDCSLKWLKNSTMKDNAIFQENTSGAICRTPAYLRGTPLKELSVEHLVC